jgi:hypothetical protein
MLALPICLGREALEQLGVLVAQGLPFGFDPMFEFGCAGRWNPSRKGPV